MKNIFFISVFLLSCLLSAQSKKDYLTKNRFNLESSNFNFPEKNFKIIGFGAYHGSVKTEIVEHKLLKSLTKDGIIKYYLPETDFSLGHYFNKFLKTGDTTLLKDLVIHSGTRVPQERTIETFNKWKTLKALNDTLKEANKLKVVGIDLLVTYKYTIKHLLELVESKDKFKSPLNSLKQIIELDTTDYSIRYESYSKKTLKAFVNDYEKNAKNYIILDENKTIIDHLINNIKVTFTDFSRKREPTIYNNYISLNDLYDFKNNAQFLRFGFSHIEKSREGKDDYPYFFTLLIENNIYKREDVISIIGYLTKSRVLWDELYDNEGHYKNYTTEGGFGIGDYEKEYFRGIDNLKASKLSSITLFKLNSKNTPYSDGFPDLIDVIMEDEASNSNAVKGMSTTEFIDYAILISNSKASKPIFEKQ
ncbi:hypothetical protein [uncultured Lacinutrix sp.]|uniref:hypothetical protein n=1 Tax=uncultured Lacinutrix sp. TaxID=574032 RepID=UPI0026369B17|nr:hypothetical protein [uncultured Lacinutrix sp.]